MILLVVLMLVVLHAAFWSLEQHTRLEAVLLICLTLLALTLIAGVAICRGAATPEPPNTTRDLIAVVSAGCFHTAILSQTPPPVVLFFAPKVAINQGAFRAFLPYPN